MLADGLKHFQTLEAVRMFRAQGWPTYPVCAGSALVYRLRPWPDDQGHDIDFIRPGCPPESDRSIPPFEALAIMEAHCRGELEKRRVFVEYDARNGGYIIFRLKGADWQWWCESSVGGTPGWVGMKLTAVRFPEYHSAQVTAMIASGPKRRAKR